MPVPKSMSDLYIAFWVFRMAGWALLAETVLLLGLIAYIIVR